MSRPVILVVDDHAPLRIAISNVLRHAFPRHEVVQCADAALALGAARLACPAAALVDVSLHGASGIELTTQLIALCPGLRVVVISQHSASVFAPKAFAAGACAFIEKQRAHEELVPAMARALGSQGHGA